MTEEIHPSQGYVLEPVVNGNYRIRLEMGPMELVCDTKNWPVYVYEVIEDWKTGITYFSVDLRKDFVESLNSMDWRWVKEFPRRVLASELYPLDEEERDMVSDILEKEDPRSDYQRGYEEALTDVLTLTGKSRSELLAEVLLLMGARP